MARTAPSGLLILLFMGCAPPQNTNHAQPGEMVRVVRFTVRPDAQAEFEEFFWASLKPAARSIASGREDPIGSFRLLIPDSPGGDGFYTYYVLVDPVRGDGPFGEAMRDMVRAAFPGAEGQRRVERWMSSMVLGDRAPVGEDFVEADLSTERPPAR